MAPPNEEDRLVTNDDLAFGNRLSLFARASKVGVSQAAASSASTARPISPNPEPLGQRQGC